MAPKSHPFPEPYNGNARNCLRRLMVERWDDKQTRAAEALKVSQSLLSLALRPGGGVGAKLLFAMREATGMSLDEILGMSQRSGQPSLEQIAEAVASRLRPDMAAACRIPELPPKRAAFPTPTPTPKSSVAVVVRRKRR